MVLWRAIQRLRLPVVIFINKVDRAGADPDRVRAELRTRLADPSGVGLVVLSNAVRVGVAAAQVAAIDEVEGANLEVLADHDLRILEDVVEHESPDQELAYRTVRSLWADGSVAPGLMGSALTGAGVAELTDLLARFPVRRPVSEGLSAVVFGTGAAHAVIGEEDNPYLATLGVRVEAAPIGTGVQIDLEVELGSMPASLFAAAREGIETGLAQGRHGWRIPDARVVITRTGYWPRQSHMHQKFNKAMSSVTADFRNLAPVLVHRGLDRAGTVVCEPVNSFTLETTEVSVDAVFSLVARLEGVVADLQPVHDRITLTGTIPVRQVRTLATALPDLTRGEAILTVEHDHFRPVVGRPPERPRVGPDPLDSTIWFRTHPR